MPIYDYRCENCGEFELEQRIAEEPLSKCPKCGGKVKRLISAAGIVFKGPGFHVTDYKKEKPKKEIKKPVEHKNEETTKSEVKKPETKKSTENK
ncbi:FmdB family zinc ribbon protein [Candidatus Margulisiibacteriota bacterium]